VTTQLESLALSLLGIFAVTAGLSRSLRHGLLCGVPAAFAVLLDFAVLGWLRIPLGVATSMFAGMTLGVGVDYAIHLLDRLERARPCETEEAARVSALALAAAGPATLTDAASTILGFSVLLVSQVPANERLGGLLALSLTACVAATLLVIPALSRPRKAEQPRRRAGEAVDAVEMGRAGRASRRSDPSTAHEMEHDHDDGDDEEDVNQTAGDVEREETEGPQHEQNQSDG
jgi:predicted RND superfamily exporter protein